MNHIPILTFIINLQSRIDRRESVLKEFAGREEFAIQIVQPLPHKIGAISLWNTMKHIVKSQLNSNNDFVLICEDDHQFTTSYNKAELLIYIAEAMKLGADALFGGVHWLNSAIPVSKNIFWVEMFTGTQFSIIFRGFFKAMLAADFGANDAADFKIASISNKIFFTHPFISIQKDFGYSDVTAQNNKEGRMDDLFKKSLACVHITQQIKKRYKVNAEPESSVLEDSMINDLDYISIPTYVINMPERKDLREKIENQFEGRNEFDVKIIEACRDEIAAVGLWNSIRKIIKIALANDDDVIIICSDKHEFTLQYSKGFLIQNIMEAHRQGAELLNGGIFGFGVAVPLTKNRFWVGSFFGTQFIVLYKSIFKKILNEPFDDLVITDTMFDLITSNKMVLYPFVSVQKDFHYYDVKSSNDKNKVLSIDIYAKTLDRLKSIKEADEFYSIKF